MLKLMGKKTELFHIIIRESVIIHMPNLYNKCADLPAYSEETDQHHFMSTVKSMIVITLLDSVAEHDGHYKTQCVF